MAPTLLLLLFRDTIFSFQATFVPALIVTEGGPPPYATTYLPRVHYPNAFEYLRYGYAAAATLVMFLSPRHRLRPVPDRAALAARLRRVGARLASRLLLGDLAEVVALELDALRGLRDLLDGLVWSRSWR